MSVMQDQFERPGTVLLPHKGVISSEPTALSDTVYVVLPSFDTNLKWGPCKWMPRGNTIDLPNRGDECLVVFDETQTPWIVAWWPF